MTAAATSAATAAAAPRLLHEAASSIFLVEQVERGQADVSNFFFAEDDPLLG